MPIARTRLVRYDTYMDQYETTRQAYKPNLIAVLFIAESQPPAADVASSRQFYRSDRQRSGDRLFVNTIRALYPETSDIPEKSIEEQKETWLRRFQADGYYMIEALDESLPHEVTKRERQGKIRQHLPALIKKVRALASPDTRLILIKSNVFDVAAGPLRQAGFNVLNTELVDYPGRFNQRVYREKVARLLSIAAAH